MNRHVASMRVGCGGFTLFEALVATALMGLVLSALAALTAQWLPNWDRGIGRVQRAEAVGLALDRLVADIAASQFIIPNRDSKQPLFDGSDTALTFVRTSLGPNARPGLDVVHIAETADSRGQVLVRSRTAFAPFSTAAVAVSQLSFSEPAALLRAPYHVSFAYAGRDGVYHDSWHGVDALPSFVRLLVRNDTTEQTLAISTATMVHVEAPASIVCADGKCGGQLEPAAGQPDNGNSNSKSERN
ncbi:MAG: type II secretion system protein J [Xanthobacteraceae bacterium]